MLRSSHSEVQYSDYLNELLVGASPYGAFAMGMAAIGVLMSSRGTHLAPRELLEECRNCREPGEGELILAAWLEKQRRGNAA